MSHNPITLALELSQRTGSVAMMNRSGAIAATSVSVGSTTEDTLFCSIDELSQKLNIKPKEIELMVVSVGPGGFTGLRTSTAIAKMVSMVSGATIVPVESAIVVASHGNEGNGPFYVLSSIKNNHTWLSKVWQQDGKWFCKSKNTTLDQVVSKLKGVSGVFADSHLPKETRSAIESRKIPVYQCCPEAESLLRIGLRFFSDGDCVDPWDLLPVYPREPEAVRLWKERKV